MIQNIFGILDENKNVCHDTKNKTEMLNKIFSELWRNIYLENWVLGDWNFVFVNPCCKHLNWTLFYLFWPVENCFT